MDAQTQNNTDTRVATPISRMGRTLILMQDVVELVAGMLPPHYFTRQGDKVHTPFSERVEFAKSLLIMDPTEEKQPLMATVNWTTRRPRPIPRILVPIIKDGFFKYGSDKKVELEPQVLKAHVLVGNTTIPLPGHSDYVATEVFPLILLDGNGFYLPYIKKIVKHGTSTVYDCEDDMLCFFFKDINEWSRELIWRDWKRQIPQLLAVPVALARAYTVMMWNELVQRRLLQDPTYPAKRELVKPMRHNLYGRKVLKMIPRGHPVMEGLVGLTTAETKEGELPDSKAVNWVADFILGKPVTKSSDVEFIPPAVDGHYYDPQKVAYKEVWKGITITSVDSVWGENTQVDTHVVSGEREEVDVMKALGISLYSTDPRGVKDLVESRINGGLDESNLLLAYLLENGHVQADTPEKTIRSYMRGLKDVLLEGARKVYRHAKDDIVGDSGRHITDLNDQLTQILCGEATPENLRDACRRKEGDPDALCKWLLERAVVQKLDLNEWDWNCWVLREARRELLLILARVNGLELPPKPVEEPKPQVEAAKEETAPSSAAEPGETPTDKPAESGSSQAKDAQEKPAENGAEKRSRTLPRRGQMPPTTPATDKPADES